MTRAIMYKDPELALQLAQDPATPSDTLSALAEAHLGDEVRRLLVQNPNTPLPVLRELAHRYPAEFFLNPILPILLLEGVEVLGALMSEDLCAAPNTPSYFLASAAMLGAHPTLLAIHPNTPKDTLKTLWHRHGAWLFQALIQHRDCPQASLSELATSYEAGRRAQAASHLNTAPSLLERLAKDPEPSVRVEVARNPKTPPATRALLCRDPARPVSMAANRFPVCLEGSELELRKVARAGFQGVAAARAHQEMLRATYPAESYECSCLHCSEASWNELQALLDAASPLDQLDIDARRMHRKRKPKDDPGRRKA